MIYNSKANLKEILGQYIKINTTIIIKNGD